jgi:hypothetical protein
MFSVILSNPQFFAGNIVHMENSTERKDDSILEIKVERCGNCGNYRGYVIERDNGEVPVLCKCDLEVEYVKNNSFPSPSFISPDGENMWWTPTTNHRREDGELVHVPYFAGPQLVNKTDIPHV